MTHYRMLDRVPSVIITTNHSELKVYQGNQVFLNDGDNFELRFFNPLQEKIGVEINFNGLKKGDGLLVINPGQDITLDRFLDEQRKMLFETYTVDGNNSVAMKAIEKNGVINFNFYKERGYQNQNNFYAGAVGSIGSRGLGNLHPTGRRYSKGLMAQKVSAKWSPIQEQSFGCFADNQNDYLEASLDSVVETGRVEKGERSDQELKHVNLNFENHAFYSVSYQMLPFSAKQTTEIQEIRAYCEECGYRIRKATWKFCPKCGNHLV